MAEEKDIREQVDEDIVYCRKVWEESSYDSEKMEELFHMLLSRYMDKISGFSKGLRVIQPYDDTAERAETSRQNVRMNVDIIFHLSPVQIPYTRNSSDANVMILPSELLCIFCCVLFYAIYYIIPPVFLQDNFMT